MRDLKIVFMGTPDFAVAVLKCLIEKKYNIVGVITAPDKPAGRGRKMSESAVKIYAQAQNLQIMQPVNLKDKAFNEQLRLLGANLQIIVAFRMLPKVVWQMPEFGTFNLHASLLPNYRGAAPINWVIINGETKTGVTTFFIDEKIDTGEVILQKEIEIAQNDDAGHLHDKLMYLGSQLVIETVELIKEGTIRTKPQPLNLEVKTAFKLNKNNCKIDWTKTIDAIHQFIKGLSPYPSAWSRLYNQKKTIDIKIYRTEIIIESHSHGTGKIIASKKEMKVAVEKGYLKILEIKLPGKRTMDILSFLNGYHFEEDAKML